MSNSIRQHKIVKGGKLKKFESSLVCVLIAEGPCEPCVEEDKADRKRGGETTSWNGQAWSSLSSRGRWRTEKMEKIGCEVFCGDPTTTAVKG